MVAKMKIILSLIIVILIFLSLSCDPNSPTGILFSPPKCEITDIEKDNASPGQFAKFVMTAMNVGDGATAYNAGCTVNLKNGNTIIDRGYAYFGTLNPGESAVAEAWFTQIDNQSQYQSYNIILYWYDAEGNYYSQ